MNELKAFYQPRTLAEAFAMLEEHGDRARVLAGGTALSLSRSSRTEVLVDLSCLALDGIAEQEDGLHVGAMVTCTRLRRFLQGRPPTLLSEATAAIGSRVLQNQVTAGGNCVMVYAWSDLPVALWCADARFRLQGRQPRELSADRFFAEHPSRVLGSGELLAEIVVPKPAPATGSAYLKLGRNAVDHGLASAAVQISLGGGGLVTSARAAVGGVRGMPQLLLATALQGQRPEPARLEEVARQLAGTAKISGDYRASVDFRRQLLFSLLTDALTLAVKRAGGVA